MGNVGSVGSVGSVGNVGNVGNAGNVGNVGSVGSVGRALIFDINEFAVHDGPGIRTAVFLKGCPLRCRWCHNPEGRAFGQEILRGTNGCDHCGRCGRACETPARCTLCGACVRACHKNLRRFAAKEWTVDALAAKLVKNAGLGGVTFSGGEPLAQPDFLFAVMERIKPVHIAIETSGYAPGGVFNRMLQLVDLALLDIKMADDEMHKLYTGVSNARILQNLEALKRSGVAYEIRVPVIPGVNDTMENMRATAALLEAPGALARVELLAYNMAAGAKYDLLQEEFSFHPAAGDADLNEVSAADLHELAAAFTERHIPVFIP